MARMNLGDVEVVDEICFTSTGRGLPQLICNCEKNIIIRDDDEYCGSITIGKEHLPNLIAALNKAKELGWY